MITGQVDALRRAIVTVTVQNPANGRHASWEALVDTGFLGELLVPHSMIAIRTLHTEIERPSL